MSALLARLPGKETSANQGVSKLPDQPSSQPSMEQRLRHVEAELADARRQLHEAQVRLKFLEQAGAHSAFLDNVTDGVLFTNPNDEVIYVNPAFLRMVDAPSSGDVLSCALPDALWEVPEEKTGLFRDLHAGRYVREREWTWRGFRGRPLVVLCNASPILNDQGEYIGAALALRDITVRRALELELRQQNEAYAKLVKELQHNLEVLRETQSSLMAEANLAFASSLSAGLLHELSNAISVIEVRAYILERIADRDESLRESARKIREAVERVAALGDSLRNLPRHHESPQRFDVREVVGALLADLRNGHLLDDLEVRVSQPEAPLMLYGHPVQIRQAVRNLVVNAGEALARLPVGSARRLDLDVSANGTYSYIAVRDNGPGFEAQVIQRLYQPGNSTKVVGGRTRGLGLGLFVAHQVAEAHGGHIHVESSPGAGATVTLKLPFVSPNPQS